MTFPLRWLVWVAVAAIAVNAAVALRDAYGARAADLEHSAAFYRYHWLEGRERQDELRAANKALRRKLYQARRQLKVRWLPTVQYAIRLASDLFGVPEHELRSVASCESPGLSPFLVNRSSGASGVLQFLPSTWRNQGVPRFSVFDPVANVLAGARIVAREGWRQWSCRP